MKNNNLIKKNMGFTLIEVIVTVAIVAIIASIAAPSFRSMIENSRASSVSNELVSALLLARSEALKRSNNFSVCTSSNQTTCDTGANKNDFSIGWIVFQDCDSDGVVDAAVDCGNGGNQAEAVIKATTGMKSVAITRNGPANQQHFFTYNFSGRVATTTTFQIKKAGTSTVLREVKISRTGRVQTISN